MRDRLIYWLYQIRMWWLRRSPERMARARIEAQRELDRILREGR